MAPPIRTKDLRKQIETRMAAGKSYENAYLEMVALYPSLTKELIAILEETPSLRQRERIRMWNLPLMLLIGCSLLCKAYIFSIMVGAMASDVIIACILMAIVVAWCVLDIVCIMGMAKFRLKYYQTMTWFACVGCAGVLKPNLFREPDPALITWVVLQGLIAILCIVIRNRIGCQYIQQPNLFHLLGQNINLGPERNWIEK